MSSAPVVEPAPTELRSPAAASLGRDRSGSRFPVGSLAVAASAAGVAWVGAVALEHSGGVVAGLSAGRAVLLAPPVLVVVGLGLVAERLWPAERRPWVTRGHLQDAAFFVLHVSVVVALMTLFSVAFATLLDDRAGWLAGSWSARLPAPAVLSLAFVSMDGANWVAHWSDHRVAVLWRMHALHHSQEDVSVLTSFRAHPLSHLPGFLLASVPAFALTGHRGLAPELVVVYVCLGTVPHTNVRWTYGPFGRLLVSPAYHRLHHAVDGPAGTNLGVVLTVWDLLSGRARFPDPARPPGRTGLAGRPVPVEQAPGAPGPPLLMARQLLAPFDRRR